MEANCQKGTVRKRYNVIRTKGIHRVTSWTCGYVELTHNWIHVQYTRTGMFTTTKRLPWTLDKCLYARLCRCCGHHFQQTQHQLGMVVNPPVWLITSTGQGKWKFQFTLSLFAADCLVLRVRFRSPVRRHSSLTGLDPFIPISCTVSIWTVMRNPAISLRPNRGHAYRWRSPLGVHRHKDWSLLGNHINGRCLYAGIPCE